MKTKKLTKKEAVEFSDLMNKIFEVDEFLESITVWRDRIDGKIHIKRVYESQIEVISKKSATLRGGK